MKKIWDKTFKKIHTNKRMLVFLFTLLFMAVLFGSFFATKLSTNDLEEIKSSLDTFFSMTKQNKLNPLPAFFQSFGSHDPLNNQCRSLIDFGGSLLFQRPVFLIRADLRGPRSCI